MVDSHCAATSCLNSAIDSDFLNDEDKDNLDNSTLQQNNLSIPKKGPLVNKTLPLPLLGELKHLYQGNVQKHYFVVLP